MGRRLLVRQKDGKLVYYDIQQKQTNLNIENASGIYEIVPDDGYLLDSVSVNYEFYFPEGTKFGGSIFSVFPFPYSSTREIKSFNHFFSGSNIGAIKIDTHNATFTTYMFSDSKVTDVSKIDIDTSNVTDMSYMFSACQITNLDGWKMNTSNVKSFARMFDRCGLVTADCTLLDFSKCTSVYNMFNRCESLKIMNCIGIDFSSIRTSEDFVWQSSGNKLTSMIGGKTLEEVESEDIKACVGLCVSTTDWFYNNTVIDVASMVAIIKGLADLTGKNGCSFKFGTSNLERIPDTYKELATSKNWTLY